MAVAMAPGEGRQVVRVTDEHTYSLMKEALGDILLRDEVKDLPVVVVSVAGAYRGGKSFILDFFLRYLQASPTERESGSWLGGEYEQLVGFTWRGGTERETTGIHLWSEPIPVTLDSGEKVVVLLMDTQGTFDSESTFRDCSTIFALSALISSVQIYNLSGNIKEDDLQHLQLFTRYGALARAEGASGKAFQELKFLVRDWQNPANNPYGATGGEQLLQKRLEINDQQPQEIRSLREQIRDTFEHLSCFLMPYPGSCVTDPNFSGSLYRLEKDFKTTLLELVPSIFKTCNLTPKIINGEKVKAKALFEYIKIYMNTFNSRELPEPTNILKATSEAGLLMASRDSREVYDSEMQQHCGADRPSVTPTTLETLHRAAVRAAIDAFNNKRKLASEEQCDIYLAQLTQELEECLPDFISSNNAKIRTATIQAKEAYEARVNEWRGLNQLCLHPEDLNISHQLNVEAVLSNFDLTRRLTTGEVDNERISLVQYFGNRLEELRRTNVENNSAAVLMSREAYIRNMERAFDNRICVTARLLARNHARLYDDAVNTFMARRNRPFEHATDDYQTELIDSIETHFHRVEISNNNNSRTLLHAAMYIYNNIMASISNGTVSLHPEELRREHEAAKAQALVDFDGSRLSDEDDDDEVKTNLLTELENRYRQLCTQNEANNRLAIEAAIVEYCRRMEQHYGDSLLSRLDRIPQVAIRNEFEEGTHHDRYTSDAHRVFWTRRRNRGEFGGDIYFQELEEKLNQRHEEFRRIIENRVPIIGGAEDGSWADFYDKYPGAFDPLTY